MAKVFTITQGLENVGPMKTGGQGSVYKGRRTGEIITAVKLLPTPIHSEDSEDKSFRDFKNEVEKLKRVNEKPNPNVVKILSSGLSETGNFPFIEMEYIEGPDLEELLKPPHDPVFTIKEVIKVAEQLSNALAHCHSLGVKHGDIKSNNVKFNIHTGNYVLLDFGLAIMSDEQRRISLRQAGAAEFMAPEQNEGQMLFQTDVYSFGIVLFELLTGRVPFALEDKGETARNKVRLAHMEALPPDIVSLRKEALPPAWPADKGAREINIPEWLTTAIYKCLNKEPQNRFSNGMDLNNFIAKNRIHASVPDDIKEQSILIEQEKQQLQKQLLQYREELNGKEKEFEVLQIKAKDKNAGAQLSEVKASSDTLDEARVAKSSFIAVLFLAVALAAFSGYSYIRNKKQENRVVTSSNKDKTIFRNANLPAAKKSNTKIKKQATSKRNRADSTFTSKNLKKPIKNLPPSPAAVKKEIAGDTLNQNLPDKTSAKYTVISKAYFHNTPDETSRRPAYVTPLDNAVLTPSDEMNGFVYIVFTNSKGQTSRGWLRKKDLKPL